MLAEGLAVVVSLAVIGFCLFVLGVLAFDPDRGETWTSGLRPAQFFEELDADLLDDYANAFGVAHNSGDRIDATIEAISYGADVIEVDVVSFDGQLYASHGLPVPFIGESVFRGPLLAQIWIASAGAGAIKLDLKESSPAFREMLFDFLEIRRGQRRVLLVSDDPSLLRQAAKREPWVFRIFSAGSTERLRLIEEDPAFAAIVDGVSIRHTLIDEELAAWLEERELLTLAWTVNRLERVNELVRLGVDGVTTDNLAILQLLGNRESGVHPLDRLRLLRPAAPPGSVPEEGTPQAATATDAPRVAQGRRRRRPRPGEPTRAGPRPASR
jgi:hypothetical protein